MDKDRKRVLFLAPQPFFETRGTPLNIRNMVTVLGEKGYEIDLVTYHIGMDLDIKNVRICRIAKVPFIKRVKIGPSYIKVFLDLFLFFKALKLCIKNRYYVIHAVEEAVYIGLILKRLFNTIFLYDKDSDIPEQLAYSNFIKSSFLLRLARKMDNYAIKNSDAVLTVCSDMTESVRRHFPSQMIFQIEDVPVSIDSDEEMRSQEKIRDILGLGSEKVIIYTGNFEDYQGVDILLRSIPIVVREYKDVRFVLVGGEEEQIEEKTMLVKELGVVQWVAFTGKRPVVEMDSYMSLAYILVSPRIEGANTPLKIYSYLASGKPIIATRLKTHTQVLNDDVAILVEPDPNSLAIGIINLLEDYELCLRMGEKGKRLVDEKYNFREFSKKVEEVYVFLNKMSKR